ncbi:glutathione peroxidase [Salinicoccus halitifaciens]|uniref:Glutathione peroxidase n=1 Tax=Salinicoccus halitifaciens TaxID=1073415 RepID=A0ABV2EC78_9STAP|nr:glutathione peroxidase [Salinicoccus halitifaciens]MCD2138510.1 glutathione peroxidase [Salinicoccus halitifaciens]
MSIYDIEVKKTDGTTYKLEEYKGRPMLIVNTASKCGFAGQFDGLEKLYQDHKEDGLVVLGFPSNQFGNQEPGSAEEAEESCRLNYGVTFPIHEKIDVNGEDAHPLYDYLKSSKKGLFTDNIKWNFTKFLVDKNGEVVERFSPKTKPESIEEDIEKVL